MIAAIIIAILICGLNSLVAVQIFNRAFHKEISDFNRIVLTSLVVRFAIMLFVAWIGIKYFVGHELTFSLAMLISAFTMLMAEIVYIHNKTISLNLQNRTTK